MNRLSAALAQAAELRDAFDRARAIPFSSQAVEPIENLLAIRLSGDAFAIRLSEISGLATDQRIVAFPSPIPELFGIAGIRGRLVPVYSLAALLGYSANADHGRWLVLCGAEEPVGFAINDFEGYLQAPFAQIYVAEKSDAVSPYVTHLVRTSDAVRALVSIPLLVEVIRRRCCDVSDPKER